MPSQLSSALVLSTTGWICKTFLRFATKEYRIDGLPTLLDALRISEKWKGKEKEIEARGKTDVMPRRGIVTGMSSLAVAISLLKREELMEKFNVGDAAERYVMAAGETVAYLSEYTVDVGRYVSCFPITERSRCWLMLMNFRWTTASDVMFTRKLHAKFFGLGQVIETHRGGGIFQPAVDEAVKKVQNGDWIHIFPEGKVNQEISHPEGGILRFKWGVGRIIMDSNVMPEIIPMWISGFDQIMNERRKFPRFIPRSGAKISITVGEPITETIRPLVESWKKLAASQRGSVGVGGEWARETEDSVTSPRAGDERQARELGEVGDGKEKEIRIKICEILQESVRQLGVKVEQREGRFERKEWCQSTPNVGSSTD
ncbi:monolysocardiolipin acyltransferase, partial [Tremellales sp. Uapishka_1]